MKSVGVHGGEDPAFLLMLVAVAKLGCLRETGAHIAHALREHDDVFVHVVVFVHVGLFEVLEDLLPVADRLKVA